MKPPLADYRALSRLARINLWALGAAVAALSVWLWPEWLHNPDLSHGLLMPLVFLLLVHEARRGVPRFLRSGAGTTIALSLFLTGAMAALVAAGLYAAAVDWSHPLVDCCLTATLVLFLAAGLLLFASESVRFIGFNWTAVVAVLLWCLCAPVPPGTYTRLTMTLQLWVSESVLQTLHLVGIAAIRHGNIIELSRATVGVEEACSGVRSLISCVYAGLFFSATLVRRPWARALIIVLSAPLALGMNFVRSLTLTLLCNAAIDISHTWHDATGFAVLAVTAALLAGLAVLLERRDVPVADVAPAATHPSTPRARSAIALLTTLGLAGAVVLACIANTRPSVHARSPVPDLPALLPASGAGWDVATSDDLYQFSGTLHTNHLAQRIYRKRASDGSITEIILYAAYWQPGAAPVSLVASHTPDACWPGAGWQPQPVRTPRVALEIDGRSLPQAEYRRFTYSDFPQYVWFWHLYDGVPIEYRDPYSPIELLRIAWHYGFRHNGDQMFIRVSSNRPWADLVGDPLLQQFFRNTRRLGL